MLKQNPPVEVGDRLWMLGTAAYPLYLVRGQNEGAIIEGGVSAVGLCSAANSPIWASSPDFVRQIVVTHAHPDHVMAIPLLREMFPGATVAASTVAAATLGTEKAVAFFRQVDAALTAALVQEEVITDQPSLPPQGENRIAVDRVLHEGDAIAVEDMAWTVLETPGHSDCSISLHDPARRLLVISDATGYYMPESNYLVAELFFRLCGLRAFDRAAGRPRMPKCSA